MANLFKKLAETFKEMSIEAQLLVVKSKHKKYAKADKKLILNDLMDYGESLDRILRSKAILDVVMPNQSGITLRPMEAIFLGKKIITTNRYITKYPFYNDKQVYVIRDESLPNIKEFLETEIDPVPLKVMEEYTPTGWLDRFFMACFKNSHLMFKNPLKEQKATPSCAA